MPHPGQGLRRVSSGIPPLPRKAPRLQGVIHTGCTPVPPSTPARPPIASPRSVAPASSPPPPPLFCPPLAIPPTASPGKSSP
ncbi:hypothetical protein VULLAG_LOCUS12290 [Vulpes lagopus]